MGKIKWETKDLIFSPNKLNKSVNQEHECKILFMLSLCFHVEPNLSIKTNVGELKIDLC